MDRDRCDRCCGDPPGKNFADIHGPRTAQAPAQGVTAVEWAGAQRFRRMIPTANMTARAAPEADVGTAVAWLTGVRMKVAELREELGKHADAHRRDLSFVLPNLAGDTG